MIFSLISILFALLALGFLVFIHELGHYYMARKVGMRVETFAIGFGRPIFKWVKDDVNWQIGWIPFGGYVKIAGQDFSKDVNPYLTPGSFFNKSPWDRIKVAFMGPLVNLLFALLVFTVLWVAGGREKNFSEYTAKIGWIDPKSELYKQGIRPGDEISGYNHQPFQGAKDHLQAPIMAGTKEIVVEGAKVNYETHEKTPFSYEVGTYPHPAALSKDIVTTGILQPANYLIYGKLSPNKDNLLPAGSPLANSGLQYNDRIFWVDGEVIYSSMQLQHLLNEARVLLTVERNGNRFLARVPRVLINDLKLTSETKEELTDWQYEAKLNSSRFQDLYTIPYNLNNQAIVESSIKFIDNEHEIKAFPETNFSSLEKPLQAGDRIVAVHNVPVNDSAKLLKELQENAVTIIVQRDPAINQVVSTNASDAAFDNKVDWADFHKIENSIGSLEPLTVAGEFVLLNSVVPKTRLDIFTSPEKQAWMKEEMQNEKKEIDAIEDPDVKAKVQHLIDAKEKELILGLPAVKDKKVSYNPNPFELFMNVFKEIYSTLKALVTGSLNPKWVSGPVGILQVVHDSSMVGLKEALYWVGAISLNLGLLNLLPIPVLDGGMILMSFIEMITGKRIHPKTLEKIVFPFAILLIMFFIYLTFNDISRIIT